MKFGLNAFTAVCVHVFALKTNTSTYSHIGACTYTVCADVAFALFCNACKSRKAIIQLFRPPSIARVIRSHPIESV